MVDASALIKYLLRGASRLSIEQNIRRGEVDLHVPALCDVEVMSALRRGLLGGRLSLDRAGLALQALIDLPLTRHGHQTLLARILGLRQNFSVYDATYVALAEALSATLLTADSRLARTIRAHLTLRVIAAG
ncbi:MAG: type II toxin-antitoxin system VapC family toxin [Acidobacteriota bacterium]